MSVINRIENGLLELSGDVFQKLADAYLHKKGYANINPLGTVIGADKVRQGTPDSLVTLPNGKYVFIEYTTQQDALYKKLRSDLDKCLDESKTGVSVEKIEEIIFCHVSKLLPAHEDDLRVECQRHGIKLNMFGIGPIAYDLYQKYPGLARDYLGVEVDTGQLLELEDFVSTYNKNKLATSLDTVFHYREDEMKRLLDGLGNQNVVIVSGHAGVGKSRLALEGCRRFLEQHPNFEVRCVFNRGVDLFEDLRVYLAEPKSYLLFVDDANRLSQFGHILEFLHEEKVGRQIKVIATVRDYALGKIHESIRPYGDAFEIELSPLADEQLTELLKAEYEITNPHVQKRINQIAKGNPRLAIMSADVAVRKNSLSAIQDVSMIYEEYFSSIRQDIEALGNSELLIIAGIVAFLRVVDRTNREQMQKIQVTIGVSEEAFWQGVNQLHAMEVFDMYENDVVRVSDQVLATYLYYLACFQEQVVEFYTLLENYFPHQKHRFVDSLNPVFQAFDARKIRDKIRPHVEKMRKSLEQAEDEKGVLQLFDVFWFVNETETLLHMKRLVSGTPRDTAEREFVIMDDSNSSMPALVKVLSYFMQSSTESLQMALTLLFDYLEKQPSQLSGIYRLLTDRFNFQYDSELRGFEVQRTMLNALWEKAKSGENQFFSKLFMEVARKYLPTRYSTTEFESNKRFSMIQFELLPVTEVLEIRSGLWGRLLQLYEVPSYQARILEILREYSSNRYDATVTEIIEHDAGHIIPFIERALDPDRYEHCRVVHDVLKLLQDRGITQKNELGLRFRNRVYELAELLLEDWLDRSDLGFGYEEYSRYRRERLKSYFGGFALEDFEEFFASCVPIYRTSTVDGDEHQFVNSIGEVLFVAAEVLPALYPAVIDHYLGLGDPFHIASRYSVIAGLLKTCGPEHVYELLSDKEYPSKHRWLFDFYQCLEVDAITAKHIADLYSLYEQAKDSDIPRDFDYLLRYRKVDRMVVPTVVGILLEKSVGPIVSLFNSFSDISKELFEQFEGQIDLLKRAYLEVGAERGGVDRDGQFMNQLLDRDQRFLFEYLERMSEVERFSIRNSRNLTFLWMREDYQTIMNGVLNFLFAREQAGLAFGALEVNKFIILDVNNSDRQEVEKRQDQVVTRLIKVRNQENEFMHFLFEVIMLFSHSRRRAFLTLYLANNQNFNHFKRIPLDSGSFGWTGSMVSAIQEKIDYLETLLPIVNKVELLEHKQKIERKIQSHREWAEREKKNDFMED